MKKKFNLKLTAFLVSLFISLMIIILGNKNPYCLSFGFVFMSVSMVLYVLYNNEKTTKTILELDNAIDELDETEEEMEVALICTMFLESTAFCDRTAGIGYKVEDSPYYTTQKELRDKYDPNFIPMIKEMHEINQ